MSFLLLALVAITIVCIWKANGQDILQKINSAETSSSERNLLLQQLDQSDFFDDLKSAANLFYFGNEFIAPDYEKSLKKFERAYALNQSDSDVLFMLGVMYSYGVGCDLDHPKGLLFIIASARLGNGQAHSALGNAYYYGLGVEKNCPSSRVYLISAARKCLKELSTKDAMSVRKPTRLSVKSADIDKVKSQQDALEYYEYSAKGGDAASSLILAQLYYFGTDGSEPDYEKARILFENSILLGHESSYAFLGQMYYRGEGVPVDYEKAFDYFVKAAQGNSPSALNGLGLMYWHGQVVEKDLDTAESYFKQAANLKYPEALYNYAMVLLEQPTLFATEKVFQNLLAAAKLGYVFANVEIVKRYLKTESSCNTSINFLKQVLDKGPSLKLFKEAHQFFVTGFEDQALSRYIYLAAQGYEIANFNAAFILERTKDRIHLKRAAFFYSRSAIMDHSFARKKLGDVYSKMGDQISAVAHYVVAAKSDNPDPEALFNLGYAYETGIGLKKDLWSALDMYTASLSQGKSGKIAVSLALTKIRVKIFLENLKTLNVPGIKRNVLKSRKETNQIFSMLLTLLLTSVIYWYINYYHPQHQNNNNRALPQRQLHNPEPVRVNDQERPASIHSDSSSSLPQTEFATFRFRRDPVETDEEQKEIDEVD